MSNHDNGFGHNYYVYYDPKPVEAAQPADKQAENVEAAAYIKALTKTLMDGLAMTFEARRQEVGLKAARADTLSAVLCVLEATSFYLALDPGAIDEVMQMGTIYRALGKPMPELKLSGDAEVELLAVLEKKHGVTLAEVPQGY